MITHRSILLSALTISIITGISACTPQADVGPNGTTLDVDDLAKSIEAKIKDNVKGYQIVIYADGSLKASRAGGSARMSQDAPARTMSIGDKINVASVSKTVTAAALMKLLTDNKIDVDDKFWSYLPSHWSIPASVKALSFRQLFTHKSGFLTHYGSDYANLKKLVANGASVNKPYLYNNSNYALMRFLIAKLSGASITPVPTNATAAQLSFTETTQAEQYTYAYIANCQESVFDKVGIAPNMACKPTDTNPALCYKWAAPNGNGTAWGDMTFTNAERGWNMSGLQMAALLNTLNTTSKIVPTTVAKAMRTDSLGYDGCNMQTNSGVKYYFKNGGYPAGNNPGEVSAWIFGFENNVHMAVLVNSDYKSGNIFSDIINSFDEWYKKK
ncbi:serine hydrolase [Fibrella sp. ES10-3-2-2]|nr:hypothetical protein A6C57_20835 [Fibrella sp. ES10-3-2-2]